jgi:hypothetical protein
MSWVDVRSECLRDYEVKWKGGTRPAKQEWLRNSPAAMRKGFNPPQVPEATLSIIDFHPRRKSDRTPEEIRRIVSQGEYKLVSPPPPPRHPPSPSLSASSHQGAPPTRLYPRRLDPRIASVKRRRKEREDRGREMRRQNVVLLKTATPTGSPLTRNTSVTFVKRRRKEREDRGREMRRQNLILK